MFPSSNIGDVAAGASESIGAVRQSLIIVRLAGSEPAINYLHDFQAVERPQKKYQLSQQQYFSEDM